MNLSTNLSHERQETAAITASQTADELVKLICKLRWIGMDEEAERLSRELTRRDAATDSVVASPHATD